MTNGSYYDKLKHDEDNKIHTKKITVSDIISMKEKQKKISVLTAYDFCTAKICDKAGIDILLVGDSAGMVMMGHKNTINVTMEEMTIFCKSVSNGVSRAMIVTDMPFGSYQINSDMAVKNAIHLIKSGSDAIKLEGGIEISKTIKEIIRAGIPVMGHIGLKPQTSTLWEGYKVQGTTKSAALKLLEEAKMLEEAGIFSLVLEMTSSEVSEIITNNIKIPTIGIGSGNSCDGQVLVLHDMLGLYDLLKPKFVKKYADVGKIIYEAVSKYNEEVKNNDFPSIEHSFIMKENELAKLKDNLY